MSGKRGMVLLATLFAAILAISGCGSSMKESGGDQTGAAGEDFGADPVTGIAYVGAGKCIECHQGFSWSAAAVEGYLAGKHVVHSTHITALEVEEAGCTCHDPIGAGATVEPYLATSVIPADGLAAVTCEDCHGAGGEHWGVGPISVAKPGADVCGKCHDVFDDTNDAAGSHRLYHQEGQGIYTNFVGSSHWVEGQVEHAESVCVKCHSDEGARLYKEYMTTAQLALAVLPEGELSPLQCRTCHDPHNAGGLLKEGTSSYTAQYLTCTNCHGRDDVEVDALLYHSNRYYRVIDDSHYDIPSTLGTIEGYILDRKSDSHVCLDCHDVHKDPSAIGNYSATTTINQQWARSGHAGFIGQAKALAASAGPSRTTTVTKNIRLAGATADGGAGPFVEDPFTAIAEKSCARCHTSSGAALYLFSPSTYSANQNSLYTTTGPAGALKNMTGTSIAAGGNTITAIQRELIYCWACHANNSGALRDPGPVTVDYKQTSSVPVTVTFPDLPGSNGCVACHSSRKAGLAFKDNADIDWSNRSFINPHYLGAAGILFVETGYPFYGTEQYRNPSYFAHDIAGVSRTTGIGTSGPCVACHMTAATSHLFSPVAKDGSGVITTITAPTCNTAACHGGHGNITAAELEENLEGMEASLDVLQGLLESAGFWYSEGYPYWFTDGTYSTSVTNWGSEENHGAAFNLKLIKADPGAYAHNRIYTKRLLFDAIDYMEDGTRDGTADFSGNTIAAEYMKAGFLTPTAIPRPGGFPVPLP